MRNGDRKEGTQRYRRESESELELEQEDREVEKIGV